MLHLRRRLLWIIVNIFGFVAFLSYILLTSKAFSNTISNFLVKENEKVDWNDYELIKSDALRKGYGEHGQGETLSNPEEIKENEKLFETFGMSVVISDKISVNRSIPDFRHPQCLEKKYLRVLPRVSIIIIFNNEVFSVFKRTLHSLYNRTPHELIEEVILVNDHSDLDYLYEPLQSYIDEHFPDLKFETINLKRRVGLMQARVIGAEAAKSDFLFIMEPHCEMTYNWLPPLIEPLLQDRRTVTVPVVDNIEWKELTYYENDKGNTGSRGVFDWDLEYKKLSRYPIEQEKLLDPFPTPVMTGGIFMIRKDYFFEIGPYDEELLIWGAENLEMSFKINLCGGKLLEVPCSKIGHLFRAFNKFRKHESNIDFLHFNRKRIVEVWFDEFKDYVYQRDREKFKINIGGLEKPIKLKEKLNCKPFKYFIEQVAPDLIKKFPFETPSFSSGKIQLEGTDHCLEAPAEPGLPMKLSKCYDKAVGVQDFELSWYRDIRLKQTNLCLDFYEVSMDLCHLEGGNQLFKYDWKARQIISLKNKQCLEADVETLQLKFTVCDDVKEVQKWSWSDFVKRSFFDSWEASGRPFEKSKYFWSD